MDGPSCGRPSSVSHFCRLVDMTRLHRLPTSYNQYWLSSQSRAVDQHFVPHRQSPASRLTRNLQPISPCSLHTDSLAHWHGNPKRLVKENSGTPVRRNSRNKNHDVGGSRGGWSDSKRPHGVEPAELFRYPQVYRSVPTPRDYAWFDVLLSPLGCSGYPKRDNALALTRCRGLSRLGALAPWLGPRSLRWRIHAR